MHMSTLRRFVRRVGYAWKRCRRSLRAQRDPGAFAACQQHLRALHRAEAAGGAAVVYLDECRFSRHAPVPYAWQRRAQPPVELPAVRRGGGYSVLGFWHPGGPGQPLDACVRTGARTADPFVLAVNEFVEQLTAPAILVLANASIHTAHLVRERHAAGAATGLTLLFLPPCRPERNKIEVRWHRCKHYWVRPEDYHTDLTLLERIEHVLMQVGQKYIVTFA